jgi:hypothetical protein
LRWNRRPPGIVTIAWIAVAIGLLPMPYGYYTLVRLFFCGVSLFYLTRPAGVRDGEKWVLVGLAVLYNPLVPVELGDKTLWTIVNIATVAYFQVLSRRATSARRW